MQKHYDVSNEGQQGVHAILSKHLRTEAETADMPDVENHHRSNQSADLNE
jgi:hypothetical protein